MADPYFARSLTYVCEHNDQGALGVVVNRPIDMTLQALFERLSLTLKDRELSDAPIYFGGPVETDRGFVLHEPARLAISPDVRAAVFHTSHDNEELDNYLGQLVNYNEKEIY